MEEQETSFLFVGNQLCLDYINTERIVNGRRTSLIGNFADLEAWLMETEVANKAAIDAISAPWDAREREEFVWRAMAFRHILRTMVEQLTSGQAVSDYVLGVLNHWLAQRKGYQVLVRSGVGYQATMRYDETAEALLAPVAEAALELLAHGDVTRVRKCESSDCILYFYDTSKNHARRWCSMGTCGNRAKAAAHYQRNRSKK